MANLPFQERFGRRNHKFSFPRHTDSEEGEKEYIPMQQIPMPNLSAPQPLPDDKSINDLVKELETINKFLENRKLKSENKDNNISALGSAPTDSATL